MARVLVRSLSTACLMVLSSQIQTAGQIEPSKSVTIKGIQYDCRIWPGDARLPAVLATHGLGDATDSFAVLGNGGKLLNTVIAVSMRGVCGTTPLGSSDSYTLDTFVEDIANWIHHFQLSKPLLLGASFGGPPVIRFANHNPDAISGIILVDSLPQVKPEATETACRKLSAVWSDYSAALTDFCKNLGVSEEHGKLLMTTRLRRSFNEWRYAIDLRVLSTLSAKFFTETETDARTLSCPVLCLRSSEQSIIADAAWDNLKDRIPAAQGVIVPNSRHTIMITAPVISAPW